MNEYILIVEDEAILYRRMKKLLKKEGFKTSDYTPSVAEALDRIQEKKPDLVLLDIQLKGTETGLDLGKKLHDEMGIPFIYVTDFDTDLFFSKGLATHHEHYLVKTKPSLNSKELIRVIHTVLARQKENKKFDNTAQKEPKLGISGLVNYLDEIKNLGRNSITRKPVLFTDIAFFSSDVHLLEKYHTEKRNNYIWFITQNDEILFLKKSLKDIYNGLPDYFVRVSDKYIISLHPNVFEGKVNNKTVLVKGEKITISDSYKKEFDKRYNAYFFS